jgi:hypothetical protein
MSGEQGTGWILPLVIGSVAGAFASLIVLSWLGDLTPNGVEFLDLAAVLLTASGVIVTCLGVAFALAAFWGFAELKKSAIRAAQSAAIREVKEQIENGSIRDYIRMAVIEEIESPDMEQRIRDRVDEIAMGNPSKDAELEYEEEGE